MRIGSDGVIVLDDDSSSTGRGSGNRRRRRPASQGTSINDVIEIDDSSSGSDQQRRPSAAAVAAAARTSQKKKNEVICIDSSSGDDDDDDATEIPVSYASQAMLQRKKAPQPTRSISRPGVSDESSPSPPGSSRKGASSTKASSDDGKRRGEMAANTGRSIDHGNPKGGNRKLKGTITSNNRQDNRASTKYEGSSEDSDESNEWNMTRKAAKTNHLNDGPKVGGRKDSFHPKNGEIMARTRKSDQQMISTKHKPKSPPMAAPHKNERGQMRCPTCFTYVSKEHFERHKSTCGHDLIGEFQNDGHDGMHVASLPVLTLGNGMSQHEYEGSPTNKGHKANNNNNVKISNKKRKSKGDDDDSKKKTKKQAPSVPIWDTKNDKKKPPLSPSPSKKVFNCKKPVPTDKLKINNKMKDSKLTTGLKKSPIKGSPFALKHPRKTASLNGSSHHTSSQHHQDLPFMMKSGSSSKRKGVPKKYQKVDDSWRRQVENAIREYRKSRKVHENELIRNALKAKNELLTKARAMAPAEIEFPVLTAGTLNMECSRLDDPDYPLPRDDFTTIFLKKHFVTEEKTEEICELEVKSSKQAGGAYEDAILSTNMSKDKIRFAAQIEEFNDMEKIGVGYEEIDIDEEISQLLERLQDLRHNRDDVHRYLALLIQEPLQRVKDQYYKKVKKRSKPESNRVENSVDTYVPTMSSFRDLFCRRCLTYDCNLHGLTEDICPTTQAEIAIHRESTGYWKERSPMMCYPVAASPDNPTSNPDCPLSFEDKKPSAQALGRKTKLAETEKVLCKKLFHIFQGDVDKVATVTGLSKDSIVEQADLIPFQFTMINPSNIKSNIAETGKKPGKMKNAYNATWVKKIVEKESHLFFNPCKHTGICSEETCTCVKNGFFCTKQCIWGSASRNYFRGCNCTAKCNGKSCPCFASNRECDPDLCRRCDACSDPPNEPSTTQPCRNDSIGMRRHAHLVMGKSTVAGAGWGLFTKYPLKKGDYVHEYLGEVIPQVEAEKRGLVYDEKNQTYLFDLTSDCAIDALRKGNKTRFINHNVNPNLAPKILVVNGDFRIGFFAQKDIPAQTELFFDYGKMFFSSKGKFGTTRKQNASNAGIEKTTSS